MSSYTYFNLLEASGKPGCPICGLTRRSVEQYFEGLFYENVNDWDLRRQLRRSMGFCSLHAWELFETGLGDALGVSIIYHDILSSVLKGFPVPAPSPISSAGLLSRLGWIPRRLTEKVKAALQALTPKEVCPACKQRDSTTELLLSAFLENLQNQDMARAFEESDGLCLPHLRQAFAIINDEQTFQILLEASRVKLAALDGELTEIIRKNDYRFRQEEFGAEKDAWRRVLRVVSGGKDFGTLR